MSDKNFAAAVHRLCYEEERYGTPEIVPNADGGHDYEFYLTPSRLLNVAAHDGQLFWAWLYDDEKGHGSAPDDGNVPEIIWQVVGRITGSQGAHDPR